MTEPNIACVSNLMADPSRAATCLALAGGEARPAGELVARAGVSAQEDRAFFEPVRSSEPAAGDRQAHSMA